MGFFKDFKSDMYKKKALRIMLLFLISFFILDFFVGIVLKNGLEAYYGLNQNAKIALVGHSHLMLGIDKVKMEQDLGYEVAKYTSEGVNIANRKLMIEHLLSKNNKIETIIYGVDAWMFTGEGLSKNSHALFYPFLSDTSINRFVKKAAPESEYWTRKLIKSTRYSEGLISSSLRGYFKKWDNFKFGIVSIERLKKSIALGEYRVINNNKENIDILIETIELLKKKGINIILLYVPTIDIVNQVESEKFEETLQIFINLENEYTNVEFVNFLEPFSHQYDLFFDPIHLNPKGQNKVTKELISHIKNTGNE